MRIDQNKKIIVDLTNYRNIKLTPSPPDTSRAGIPENKSTVVKRVRAGQRRGQTGSRSFLPRS
ncbi:MAG: hypothetical protein IPL53_17215 [Ignavibacteria bacterium]|nr:hypothetical protein [Ignavibacteria bacterium]